MELIAREQLNKNRRFSGVDIVNILLAILLIGVVLFFQLCSISVTSGESMLYTLNDGDALVVYKTKELRRGDIVTLWGEKANKKLVKRVVGEPGDRLLFVKDGIYVYMYVNGKLTEEEDYVTGRMYAEFFKRRYMYASGKYKLYEGDVKDATEDYYIVVEADTYFVLGDNRNDSLDSREYGAIPKSDIEGRVIYVIGGDTLTGKILNYFAKEKND